MVMLLCADNEWSSQRATTFWREAAGWVGERSWTSKPIMSIETQFFLSLISFGASSGTAVQFPHKQQKTPNHCHHFAVKYLPFVLNCSFCGHSRQPARLSPNVILFVLLPVYKVFTHAARPPSITATLTCIQVVLAAATKAIISCAVVVCHNKIQREESSCTLWFHAQAPCNSTLQLPTNTQLGPAH